MEIRLLRQDEAEKHFRASAISFIWPLDIKNETLSDDPRMGVFDNDGILMAELTFVPHPATFGRNTLTMLYIDEVITLPEHRRKGYIRNLFDKLEEMAPEAGWDVSGLNPFSWGYYRKFGYDRAVRKMNLSIPMRSLERFAHNCDVKLNEGAYTQDMLRLYNAFAAKNHLMLLRQNGKRYNETPYANCEYSYLWFGEGEQPRSYAVYNVDRSERTLRVRELVYNDLTSLAGILGFLRNYDGQTDFVEFSELPGHSPLEVLLGDYESAKTSVFSSVSARIYNVQAVLEKAPYPNASGSFVLRCHDTMPQNNGAFAVTYGKGSARVERIAEKCEADIELERTAAVRLLLSGEGFTATTAQFIPGVILHNPAADFFRAFAARGMTE